MADASDTGSATAPPEASPEVWHFLGVPFTPLSLEEAAARIAGRPWPAPFALVTTPNAQHVVNVARGNPLFVEAHRASWLVVNDSAILRLLGRRLFGRDLKLSPGSDLTRLLLEKWIGPEDPVTIIGGSDEVERRLRSMFGLRRIRRHDPPMGFYHDPAEIRRCVDFVRAHPARYVFLVVGSPQTETVARGLLEAGDAVGVGMCVGSSLHFATGVVRRAPAPFRRAHCEWLYRLLQNPRRHARRVFVESLPVLAIAAKARLAAHLAARRR